MRLPVVNNKVYVLIKGEKKKRLKTQDIGYIKTEVSTLAPDFCIKEKCKKILSVTSDTKLLNVVLFFSKRLPSFWKQSIFQGSHSNRVLSLEINALVDTYMNREKWDRTRNTDCWSKLSIARWENEQDDLAVVKVGCEVYIPSKCCSDTSYKKHNTSCILGST